MESFVADATSKGSKVLAGGQRIGNRGYFFPLTVPAEVPDDARAMHRSLLRYIQTLFANKPYHLMEQSLLDQVIVLPAPHYTHPSSPHRRRSGCS
jgi:hypothetical protein